MLRNEQSRSKRMLRGVASVSRRPERASAAPTMLLRHSARLR